MTLFAQLHVETQIHIYIYVEKNCQPPIHLGSTRKVAKVF